VRFGRGIVAKSKSVTGNVVVQSAVNCVNKGTTDNCFKPAFISIILMINDLCDLAVALSLSRNLSRGTV
jgi:hypothetical protein